MIGLELNGHSKNNRKIDIEKGYKKSDLEIGYKKYVGETLSECGITFFLNFNITPKRN